MAENGTTVAKGENGFEKVKRGHQTDGIRLLDDAATPHYPCNPNPGARRLPMNDGNNMINHSKYYLTLSRRLANILTEIELRHNVSKTTFKSRSDHNYLMIVGIIGAFLYDTMKSLAHQIFTTLEGSNTSTSTSVPDDASTQQVAKAQLPPRMIAMPRPYLFILTPADQNIADIVGKVILYSDMWYAHIVIAHPELKNKLFMVEEIITRPSSIYRSSSVAGSFIFTRSEMKDKYGRLLRVVVKPVVGNLSTVSTVYFSKHSGGPSV
jgi:hypothetical protein